MRLDIYLCENGYVESRQRAKVMILAGRVLLNGKAINKPSTEVKSGDDIFVGDDPIGYISRGALKLKAAFEAFDLDAIGKYAIDVGASTGGFTEYLLEKGVSKVYAVDSGVNQLAAKLLSDDRVVSMEKYNARFLSAADFPCLFDIAVMDVSFISQTLIIPALSRVMSDSSFFVGLIKPQFEVGRESVGKGGIVRSLVARSNSIKRVIDCALENGFDFVGLIPSPIEGGDGNIEFLACFSRGKCLKPYGGNIELLISNTVNV